MYNVSVIGWCGENDREWACVYDERRTHLGAVRLGENAEGEAPDHGLVPQEVYTPEDDVPQLLPRLFVFVSGLYV